jgi:hypothetical protein
VYADVVASSLRDTVFVDRLPLADVVATLDPLLTPVLDPFVEGVKGPIFQVRGLREAGAGPAAAAAACGDLGRGARLVGGPWTALTPPPLSS